MPEPVIVPPAPTVTQPSHPGQPVDTSPGLDQVQAVFDRVLPKIKTEPTPRSETTPPPVTQPKQPAETPPAPVEPIKEPAVTPPETTPVQDIPPSILEQALKGEPSQVKAPAEEEWPEELPTFKTPEESKERYRKWRKSYEGLKSELKTLQEKPTLNAQALARMEMLEGQNKQMQEVLSRLGVEHSAEFQQQIMRPLKASWTEAVRIVKDSGGDPQALAKAMSLNGRAQF